MSSGPWAVVAFVLLGTLGAGAGDDACKTTDRFQYWRRLSLDLRQRAPELEEYERLETAAAVTEADVDVLLSHPEVVELGRAYHRNLLKPFLETRSLFGPIARLDDLGSDPARRLFIRQGSRSSTYRRPDGKPCADRRQTKFESDGTPIRGSDGLDGWVEVEPYWAPGTTVRVCSFEAQSKLAARDTMDGVVTDISCANEHAWRTKRCGCGPKLSFCSTEATALVVRAAFVEQVLRHVDRMLDDRPYSDLISSGETQVNGPIAHYLRWQTGFVHDAFFGAPDVNIPDDLAFVDTASWRTVERRGAPAGVLTMPAFLLRFATNRSRASRFLDAFLCAPFEPPPGGLQLDADDEPNVAKRSGCSYCHAVLEPVAAHWARFAERGAAWLEPSAYPVDDERCRDPGRIDDPVARARCKESYFYEREPLGRLRPYEFALDGTDDGARLAANAAAGPRALVDAAISDGRFATCAARRWWRHLVRREPTEEELTRVRASFVDGGLRLRALLRAIVLDAGYRTGQ